jgi:hypothetical protein
VWGIQASVKFFTERGLAAPGILERFLRSIKEGFGG